MNELNGVKGLLTDYVNMLSKEHPTAAQIVQGYANRELSQLFNQSPKPVPDDDPED